MDAADPCEVSLPNRFESQAGRVVSDGTDDAMSTRALRLDLPGLLEETARQTARMCGAPEVGVGVVAGSGVSMTAWRVEGAELMQVDRFAVALDSSEPIARAVRDGVPVAAEGGAAEDSMSTDLVVPMIADQTAVGAIAVRGLGYGGDYLANQLLEIGSRAALAVEFVRFRRNSRRALEETITVLAAVIEGRDAYTESHCLHLAEMSLALGVRMGLEQGRLDRLNFGGLLHDIGKIAVPDAILSKPGTLTDREYDQMKAHASIGEGILERIGSLADVAPVVGQHHERLDGSGYPRGLSGEEILLEARILAVVDTFDAMTTARPYRAALPWTRAIEEISSGAGTLFDPEVADVFLRYMTGEEAQWNRQTPT